MKSFLKRFGLALVLAAGFALGVLAFPQPLFSHSVSHGKLTCLV